MDGHESAERERSEPCSARTNPFTDGEENGSRKRQRTANGAPRSRSVDATADLNLASGTTATRGGSDKAEPPVTPPAHMPLEQPPEPTSSRVTINLRTNRPLAPILSSSPSPSLAAHDGRKVSTTRVSVESESDALSNIPAIKTPSSSQSSPSDSGSPHVELVAVAEDDVDFSDQDPPLAIIGGDEVYLDPMAVFPYSSQDESLVQTVGKVASYLRFDEILDHNCFCQIRDWIEKYLAYTTDLKTFHEMYIKYRDVWLKFPDLVWALSHRSRFFGPFLNRSREGRLALTELLSQFSRLVGRFLALDVRSLEAYTKITNPDQSPELVSHIYLSAYSFLFRKDDAPHIGRNLETHYNWNWDDDMAIFSDSFRTEGGTIRNLTRLIEGQSALFHINSKLADQCTEPCRLAARAVAEAKLILDERDTHYPQQHEAALSTMVRGHEFFKVISLCLESIIEKHVSSISPESVMVHLVNLTNIYRQTLAADTSNFRQILEDFVTENPNIPRKHVVRAISYKWKFSILMKLITSTQMQLRVIGVTTMCADLLQLHGLEKSVEAPASGLLLFFAEFLLRSQLVDYIVGIGSHPELIVESSNIVGFLIVTKTYTNQQTDKIWQTVLSSQDPRVVEAILRMTMRCLNLFDYRTLLYWCTKAGEVPLPAFTATMREFCQRVFHDLLAKAAQEGVQSLKSPPYDLCVRLIRESSVTSNENPVGFAEIQNFATTQLHQLLKFGPSTEGRNAIYEDSISDVSSKSGTASGSICVINALLREYILQDLHQLTAEHGLTRLVVEEMETSVTREQSPDQFPRASQVGHARRELLLLIIANEPKSISPELRKRLWDVLVGSESKSVTDRNTSWQILNSAAKRSAFNNPFLVSCFRDHFPALSPKYFTNGALDFAREAVFAWMEETLDVFLIQGEHKFESPALDVFLIQGEHKFESPALDQLWRMILTAPPNSIDAAAINVLVEVYVDGSLIKSLSRAQARSIHLALLKRCLTQLKVAATNLQSGGSGVSNDSDDEMVVVISEDHFHEQELIFARSLAVLREFLKQYQTKPHFATPKLRPAVIAASSTVEGEPLIVKYQSFDGDKHTDVQNLTLGKSNTAAALLASLQKATGFKSYKIYCDGKEFDPDEMEICKSLAELNLNGLVLVQRREDLEGSPSHSYGTLESLALEITKHFDDLWSYLSMPENLAQDIYAFLTKLPVYDRLLNELESDAVPHSIIFPSGQPYKSLYAIHALRQFALRLPQKEHTSDSVLARTVSLIVSALLDRSIFDSCTTDDMRDCLALHFVDCLLHFLRESALPAPVDALLSGTLLARLLEFMSEARIANSTNSIHLTYKSLEVILEASLHSSELWNFFHAHLQTSTLLKDLLLEDSRLVIRKSVAKQILQLCTTTPSFTRISAAELTIAIWPLVSALIEDAVYLPLHCEEVFSLSLGLFKNLSDFHPVQDLNELVIHWGNLLLTYQCSERVGQVETIDPVAQGLANLLCCASTIVKSSQLKPSCAAVAPKIFRQHLFPQLSMDEEHDVIAPRIPILSPATRATLVDVIFSLVKDDEVHYKDILASLSDLTPYAAAEENVYIYDLPQLFERMKSIRSQTGYVGLRNLANTCYLNSLFTQLFMNVPFREFFLNAHVSDSANQQRLLSETQILFSYMQNSFRRFIDPTNLANSIEDYENSIIDVTIQMDVDEFYNLLFDRWEGQILSEDAKRRFKSFYGGKLIQQVKSKECSHISEREESFNAIQCDIKGKISLEESLQAYVEGEIMEGDNKYKCSTCDREVDAVKRACLKDIPNNLIFHLKRFEFNLRAGLRSKINDYFTFPRVLDMQPYKIDHLMDSSKHNPEEIFELVGVLVHSGSAESGHYYSYVRERPSEGSKETWVEFNDDCVSPWDPTHLEGSCFGGIDNRGPVNGGEVQYDKIYSAYMLFYERSSVLAERKRAMERLQLSSPVRLGIQPRLANFITMENELLMRKYCLYDPSHVAFVAKMLVNIHQINKGHCSTPHTLEKLALTSALNHLDQVVTRTKDLPYFKEFMDAIEEVCYRCAECSRDYLEWYCDCPETLRHMLLRNPDGEVRCRIGESIILALNKVKVDAAYAYGFGDDDDSVDEMDVGDPQLIQRIVKCILRLWDMFHTNCRAWPEYFSLLANIAKMGTLESALLLDAGFLHKTLEMVSADQVLPIAPQYLRMLNIVSKRMASKPVSFDAVLELLYSLLKVCDTSTEMDAETPSRLQMAINREPIQIAAAERHLLIQHWTRNEAHILTEKLLLLNQNYSATSGIIELLLGWQQSIDYHVRQAILQGIRKNASVVSGPFLRAALIYCEHSEDEKAIPFMIQHVAKVTYHIDNTEGREFFNFFKDCLEISSHNSRATKDDVLRLVVEHVNYWGPGLLTYYDSTVRNDTETLIRDIILSPSRDNGSEPDDESDERSEMILQAAQNLGIACLEFIQDTYLRSRIQAVRSTMLNIQEVIASCAAFFDDEAKDLHTIRFFDLRATILPALKKWMVDELEEETSEWEGSDGEGEYSSEPMDSIGPINDDLNDADVHV